MSVGELSACFNGLTRATCRKGEFEQVNRASMPVNSEDLSAMLQDNRCCFCLNLRQGVIIIGVLNFFFYLLGLAWYIGKVGFDSDFDDIEVSNIDISVFVLIFIQLITNLLLVVGAVKKIPHHTFPWLCCNAVVIALILVIIFMLVFLGASRNDLTYQEYVSYLISLSGLAGIQMFSCIVVFQFRSNLIIELRNPSIIRSSGDDNLILPTTVAPSPPAYEDTAPKAPMLKCLYEDPPPGYEDAILMPPVQANAPPPDSPVPHLRKKSLTPQV